jgi:hypothetical protein
MVTKKVRQNRSRLILHHVAKASITQGTTEVAGHIGEGVVMMLGGQAMAQMRIGGGVAVISNTSQSDPTVELQTSSRT